MTAARSAAWLVWLLGWALAGCGDEAVAGRLRCASSAQCPGGYHCAPDGVCRGDVACTNDGGCCLGERCEDGRCRPRQMCSAAAPCAEPGTVCSGQLCLPAACGPDMPCGGGRSCLWGRCVQRTPCGGRCAPGEACSVLTDRCIALRTPPQPCAPGQLAVLADADLLAEGCAERAELVSCQPLPPLPEGVLGVPGVAVPGPTGSVALVTYDRAYGDLVLARHQAQPPFARTGVQVLDGLPAKPQPSAAVSGPRGGIAEPGPDVGEALDAGVDPQGAVLVAYRDATADALRVLRVDAAGAIGAAQTLAEGPGVGTQVALALAPKTQPLTAPERWVASFQPARPGAASALVLYAAGATAVWQAIPLEATPLPAPATALIDEGPQGRGAWLDLATDAAGRLAVAAYSPSEGNLALWRGVAGKALSRQVWTGASVASADVGRFVSLQWAPDGVLMLACADHERGRLLLGRSIPSGDVSWQVLDDGRRSDGMHRVGADASLARAANGDWLVAYQDSRRGDWWLARASSPVKVSTQLLSTAGSAGWSSSALPMAAGGWLWTATTRTLTDTGAVVQSSQWYAAP